jgi:5-methyltetrahydropteroyltriglutamate--homocysteine methyltransferase
VESVAEIRALVARALEHLPAEAIFLNPDCGFGTFSARPLNTEQLALRKFEMLTQAARELRSAVPRQAEARD